MPALWRVALKKTMLHLAIDPGDIREYGETLLTSKFALASFYYCENSEYDMQAMFDHFILDSGAFSFLEAKGSKKTKKDMVAYCERYINYINKFNIENFVELDVDSLYGYEFVLMLRQMIEDGVGRKCIPIWHASRGKDEFHKMCRQYDYAGVGGIAGGEELSKHKKLYKYLNRIAKREGCRLHGMGFTPSKNLTDYEFYSVDSTSWKSGGRFGSVVAYRHGNLFNVSKREGMRVKDYKALDRHNLEQWIKYQNYCIKGA